MRLNSIRNEVSAGRVSVCGICDHGVRIACPAHTHNEVATTILEPKSTRWLVGMLWTILLSPRANVFARHQYAGRDKSFVKQARLLCEYRGQVVQAGREKLGNYSELHLSSVSAVRSDPGRSIDIREERAWASSKSTWSSVSDILALQQSHPTRT